MTKTASAFDFGCVIYLAYLFYLLSNWFAPQMQNKRERTICRDKTVFKQPAFLNFSVLLWRVVGETLEVFTYFSILWNCIMNVERTRCSYQVSKDVKPLWKKKKVYCDHSLKNLHLFSNLAETTWKAQTVCLREKNKKKEKQTGRTGDFWSHMSGKKPLVCVRVCVYSLYIYVYNLSVVKVHVYSFVNM